MTITQGTIGKRRSILPTNVRPAPGVKILSSHKIGDRNKPAIVQSDASGTPEITSKILVDREAAIMSARSQAIMGALVHRGTDETFDQHDYTHNPANGATLFDYVVPASRILRIDGLSVVYSNPQIAMCEALGWRLLINGNSPPGMSFGNLGYHWHSCGHLNELMTFTPVWVQPGAVVSLQIRLLVLLDDRITIFSRLAGKLYRSASPLIYEVP